MPSDGSAKRITRLLRLGSHPVSLDVIKAEQFSHARFFLSKYEYYAIGGKALGRATVCHIEQNFKPGSL